MITVKFHTWSVDVDPDGLETCGDVARAARLALDQQLSSPYSLMIDGTLYKPDTAFPEFALGEGVDVELVDIGDIDISSAAEHAPTKATARKRTAKTTAKKTTAKKTARTR